MKKRKENPGLCASQSGEMEEIFLLIYFWFGQLGPTKSIF